MVEILHKNMVTRMTKITLQKGVRHISVALVLFMALVSCSDTTKVHSFTVSGRVYLNLENNDTGEHLYDFAGVEVSLYEQAYYDSSMAQISVLYPLIGAAGGQISSFDVSEQTPIVIAQTKADGTFELHGVKAGTYNIVFNKIGWGDIYIYSMHIDKDTTIEHITMFPVIEVPSIAETEYTFKHNHTYSIAASTIFEHNCIFEGGSRILVAPSARLDFLGDVQFDGDNAFTHFTGSTEALLAKDYKWGGLRFVNDNVVIEKVILSGASTGISLMGSNSAIRNSVFKQVTNGIYAPSDHSYFEFCTFRNISARAIVYNQASGSDSIKHVIKYSIFENCNEGLRTLGQAVSITDNVFIKNGVAIGSFSGYHEIEHNVFDMNSTAILIQGCSITIRQNEFFDNIYSNQLLPAYYTTSSVPVFTDNNFFQSSNYAIYITPHPLPGDIDATLNYWDYQYISEILYDRYDNPQITEAINYTPQRNTPISSAGIRTPGRR